MQIKSSLPSRIAVIVNHLPRQCGIATFTTDLCEALSAEYGTARLLTVPVNDTSQSPEHMSGWYLTPPFTASLLTAWLRQAARENHANPREHS